MKAWAIGIGAVSVAIAVTIVVRMTRPPGPPSKAASTVTGSTTAHADPTEEDSEALAWDTLERSGKDLSKPVTLDFFLYFEDGDHAAAACRTLGTTGFDSALYQPTAAETQWRCIVTKTVVPTRAAVGALGAQLIEEAKRFDGDYDGWDFAPDAGAK
jgi:hypothetical protein